MIRPRRMKYLELTVHKNDINAVLEYLGKNEAVHFQDTQDGDNGPEVIRIGQIIDRLRSCAEYIGVELPVEPEAQSHIPGEIEQTLTDDLLQSIENLKDSEIRTEQEKQKVNDTFKEVKAFSNMNIPYTDLAQLSYLTLRVGRLDPVNQAALRENMGDRAVIIPLDSGKRILAASSRKGRFALDSELKKYSFEPIAIPEDYRGIPADILGALEEQLAQIDAELEKLKSKKDEIRQGAGLDLKRLESSWLLTLAVEKLKTRFTATENICLLSGWTPCDMVAKISDDMSKMSGGRIGIRTYNPEEIPEVRNGSEKVPVALKHGAFVKGFEGLIFSYGAPLYGTIDPAPMVAFFFTILFGIMFGDAGQGFVLLLAGILIGKHGLKLFSKFSKYSVPLISVGIASIVMGCLNGAVFTNEGLLIAPTRAISAFVTGHPVDRVLSILPISERGGSVKKLFYFFGFTIGIGVILNSAGLLINIVNRCIMKKYEAAFFSKTGLAGLLMFWYAVFIALRMIFGGRLEWIDLAGLLVPAFCIFFGPVIWRCITGVRPVLEHGIMTFFMEGFVEILETVSSYISNTVSFLRVGAFALSHAVLSYIVFRFSEMLALSGPAGSIPALLVMIFGNIVIIALEGMIVAIQVVRLQYYEFFNKFFTETGVEFAPFRFRTKKEF